MIKRKIRYQCSRCKEWFGSKKVADSHHDRFDSFTTGDLVINDKKLYTVIQKNIEYCTLTLNGSSREFSDDAMECYHLNKRNLKGAIRDLKMWFGKDKNRYEKQLKVLEKLIADCVEE